jgi:hypothetical protein
VKIRNGSNAQDWRMRRRPDIVTITSIEDADMVMVDVT